MSIERSSRKRSTGFSIRRWPLNQYH
jgi:hypothetical protein